MKESDELPLKLQNADVPKEKKWLISLVRWAYLHPDATYEQVLGRINLSIYNQTGYFKRYNDDKKREYNRIKTGERYRENAEFKNKNLFGVRKRRVPYNFYKAKDFVPQDTKKVTTAINRLAEDMGIEEWKP